MSESQVRERYRAKEAVQQGAERRDRHPTSTEPNRIQEAMSTQKLCRRDGCINRKRHGRQYRYCSDDCQRTVELATKADQSREWRAEHPEAVRTGNLWKRFRLTADAFDDLLRRQNGCCAICETDAPGGSGSWHVDHDHRCCPGRYSCGRCVRGLLCARCNRHILSVVEGPLLAPALAYLGRSA